MRVEADCVRKAKAGDVQKVRVVGENEQTKKRNQNKSVGGAVNPMVIFVNPVAWQCPVPPTQTRAPVVFVRGNGRGAKTIILSSWLDLNFENCFPKTITRKNYFIKISRRSQQ